MKNKLNIPDSIVMFLTRMKGKIKRGEYDEYLTIPFASRDLLYSTIMDKVMDKLSKEQNPLLNEREIIECIQVVKETAAETAAVFISKGILTKNEDGYEVNPNIKKLMK